MEFKVGSFTFGRCDKIAAEWMHQHGQTLLKYSLSIIFIWLGALKPLGLSPVNDLVTNTITWLPSDIFIPILGGMGNCHWCLPSHQASAEDCINLAIFTAVRNRTAAISTARSVLHQIPICTHT
ncbi:hypothetical protein [Pseudomonas sp.]|uniref:hypothetical protein n=1 Tax=Pseudomonas sp. TaxID=306 RepID=UPI003A971708